MSKSGKTQKSKSRVRITLNDVAQKAGVSSSTVSFILNGRGDELRIVEETQTRVLEAAKELGYVPNQLFRSVRSGRTNIVSFYSAFRHRAQSDIYQERLISSFELACGALGYDALVHCNFQRTTLETYQFLNGGWADGVLLFAPWADDPLLPLLRDSGLPTVLINKLDPAGVISSVCDDVCSGMKQMAAELVHAGHRRIATFIQTGEMVRDSEIRANLLKAFLVELGVHQADADILDVADDAAPTLKRILAEPNPPTAIFAWNDRLAYDILEACDELGIEVPGQVSVIGYDGLHWPSTSPHIAASVLVDLRQLAVSSVRLLHDQMRGNVKETRQEVLPVLFQPGSTLGPARRST